MKISVVVALMALGLAGCDQSGAKTQAPERTKCFSITPANTNQPYAAMLIDGCSGQTWLLVRSSLGPKPDDGFTYEWFSINRLDALHPQLVNKSP